MSLPHKFALLLSATGFAFGLLFSGAVSGSATIDPSAPLHFEALASVEPVAGTDTAMLALRRQARVAMAQLQTKAASNP